MIPIMLASQTILVPVALVSVAMGAAPAVGVAVAVPGAVVGNDVVVAYIYISKHQFAMSI